MRNKMNKRTIGLIAAALMLVATIGVGSALAYFTTYTTANGKKELSLEFAETDLKEEMGDGVKKLTIKNAENAERCYVRLRALVGDDFKDRIKYLEPSENKKWTVADDGYVYYKNILEPGEVATEIDVLFNLDKLTDSFNIIIIQESTPVQYDAEGNAYADWSVKAEVAESYDVAPLE